ncbi:MAG: nucleoside deaminase [Caldisericia bacterium]|nr:nucleoside deaminase [Caldisericia bacterium]
MDKKDIIFMKVALYEAKKAYSKGEIPVGAVIVKNGKVISKAHNLKEKNKDSTSHAEINAIRLATNKLNDWRLNDCEIYITKEPCIMCAGAIIESRIRRVIFGFYDKESGAFGGKINILNFINAKIIIENGILERECFEIFKSFFDILRRGG